MIESVAILAPSTSQKEELVYIKDFEKCNSNNLNGTDNSSPDLLMFDWNDIPGSEGVKDEVEEGSWKIDCSLAHQFRLLAATDLFRDGGGGGVGGGPNSTAAGASGKKDGGSGMYAGFLCALDGHRLYGWRTSTRVKIIISVKDDIPPIDVENENARDLHIQKVLKNIHASYVEFVLNPFSNTHGMIKSKKFHRRLEYFVKATS